MIQVTLLEVGVRVVRRAQERVTAIVPRMAKGV
jgi:hypothetical protein